MAEGKEDPTTTTVGRRLCGCQWWIQGGSAIFTHRCADHSPMCRPMERWEIEIVRQGDHMTDGTNHRVEVELTVRTYVGTKAKSVHTFIARSETGWRNDTLRTGAASPLAEVTAKANRALAIDAGEEDDA
jgi:hypothetical protein